MGYYGGRGVPFFKWHMPGISKDQVDNYKDLSGKIFWAHHYAGVALEILIPIHVGAVVFNLLQGKNILKRML